MRIVMMVTVTTTMAIIIETIVMMKDLVMGKMGHLAKTSIRIVEDRITLAL
jgi:hypothetical protein